MNIMHIEIEKTIRAKKRAHNLLLRMSRALLQTYSVRPEMNLALYFGFSDEMSNEEALTHWIKSQIEALDQTMADAVFHEVCNRFEKAISYLPAHQQGDI